MVILLCIVICVAYCIYDRQRKNTKEEIKAVNDRIDTLSKMVDHMFDMISQAAEEARVRVANEDAEPHYTGQSCDSGD